MSHEPFPPSPSVTPNTRSLPVYVEESFATGIVSVHVCLRTGATSDPVGKEGLFRLMMRGLRRGTTRMSAAEIDQKLDFLGAEFDEDVYATHASVNLTVLARNVKPAIELLTHILRDAAFRDEESERLKRETDAELLEATDNDRGLVNLAFRRELFAGHVFARSASGTRKTVATISAAEMRACHAAYWVQGDLVIGFSGAIKTNEAQSFAEQIAAALPKGDEKKPRSRAATLTDPTSRRGRHLVFVDKPDRSQHQILIGRLGTSPHDLDFHDLSVAVTAFGGTFSAPLMKEVRSKRGWSYGAYARLAMERARHSFTMWTFPGTDVGGACIALELELLEKFRNEGPTPAQTKFVKNYLVRGFAFDEDTSQKRLGLKMDVDLLKLRPDHYTGYRKHIAGVESEGCLKALQTRLNPEDLIIAVVGTASLHLAGIQAAIPNLESTKVIPHDSDF
jgi:zinc protease